MITIADNIRLADMEKVPRIRDHGGSDVVSPFLSLEESRRSRRIEPEVMRPADGDGGQAPSQVQTKRPWWARWGRRGPEPEAITPPRPRAALPSAPVAHVDDSIVEVSDAAGAVCGAMTGVEPAEPDSAAGPSDGPGDSFGVAAVSVGPDPAQARMRNVSDPGVQVEVTSAEPARQTMPLQEPPAEQEVSPGRNAGGGVGKPATVGPRRVFRGPSAYRSSSKASTK